VEEIMSEPGLKESKGVYKADKGKKRLLHIKGTTLN
jgi:hypothetical protein